MNINKIISLIWELKAQEKITYDETVELIEAIVYSPHLGDTISAKQQAAIDEVLDMPAHMFDSGLKIETDQDRVRRLRTEGVDIILHG